MRSHLLVVLVSTVLSGGCADSFGYTATVSTGAYGPDLVYAAPGVQVIADWNEPIFFVDGFYWRVDGGTWYRSTYHTGGWVYAAPPPVLLHIDRPYAYRHYRPHGWQPRRYEARPAPPVIRDHRTPPRYDRRPAPPPPPRDRDHRDRDRDRDRDHRR